MSLFSKVLGHKKKEKAPQLPQAIIQVKETEDVLLKKQNYLEHKIQREIAIAKQNASKNKKAALQALQRKKRYERQLQQVDGTLTTLEGQRDVLENANINTMAVTSMKKGSQALKAAHKGLDVDAVNTIMDDMADQREVADEIADAISKPVSFHDSFDEDELERELEELTGSLEELDIDEVPQEKGKKKREKEAIFGELPSVPRGDVYEKDKDKKRREKEALPAS